ncbi:MAG: class I SAM-dependent methyltransferase [Nanoarchaeota archaeon]|nr:class I SAM-dependent methyltransferase [Nanoarchaeota archaeon]
MAIKQYDYDKFAKYYDIIELKASNYYEKTNDLLDRIFKRYKVKTVLDMTCGTGAQTISLTKRGYKVTASDISKGMLEIAKEKSKGLGICFYQGDMRTVRLRKFDAVIIIFNAIAHLSKKDFEKAIRNVSENLKEHGLFIFDIFNLDFMKSGHFRDYKHMDFAMEHECVKYVRFNDNRLDSKKGIMEVNQEVYIQKGYDKPEVHKESWSMQIYSSSELKKLLEKNGFKVINFYDGNGKNFIEEKSVSIFVIAQKK